MSLDDLSGLMRAIWPLWLMLIFVAIAVYAFWPKNRRHFENCAEIPFKSDPEEPSHHD